MKAILEFDLPEEDYEFKQAVNAEWLHSGVMEFSQWLRTQYKYEGVETMELFDVRSKLFDILTEHGVDTDAF